MKLRIGLLLIYWLGFCGLLSAQTLKEAAEKIAQYFVGTSVARHSTKQLVIDVVNYHSKVKDSDAQLIESELYLAFYPLISRIQIVGAERKSGRHRFEPGGLSQSYL